MSNVIALRRPRIRPPECEQALALMRQAYAILDKLVGAGRIESGSPPEATLDYLGDAIGMLKLEGEENGVRG